MMLLSIPGFLLTLTILDTGHASTSGPNVASPEPEVSGNGVPGSESNVLHSLPRQAQSSYFPSLLLSAFPEDLEVGDYCRELLHIFGQRYVSYVNCLVPSARPVKICQNCHVEFNNLQDIYSNISSEQLGPGNASCRDTLLRSDRLMLVFQLFHDLQQIWAISNCARCLSEGGQSLSNVTLYYMATLNQSLSCFEKHQQQGNHSELCKECKKAYRDLNELYSRMEKNESLCLDIEDAMNITRKLWSKTFNCSFPREETVPVIAVSSFMLFLPIIFYLSSFLHSEQKKRKLILPKRATSHTNLMNIQDRSRSEQVLHGDYR
ncbi:osteopetrosis-associated transmembrane protein 1-like isoform X1 [Megalops cyprinoides]|uniref:osteopetrosis-associated transmembrane protein 1-like isoform X1 n=1 Tax=Megalops cyprinoides TaxID=118141 RepID=UPI001865390A|nr:osteopetrosis-associated transmembrane protein 1-like isoform X1 [Megalops cyprinoides]